MNYEQEEEFLTNDLSRKLAQVGADSSSTVPPKLAILEPIRLLGHTRDVLSRALTQGTVYRNAGCGVCFNWNKHADTYHRNASAETLLTM